MDYSWVDAEPSRELYEVHHGTYIKWAQEETCVAGTTGIFSLVWEVQGSFGQLDQMLWDSLPKHLLRQAVIGSYPQGVVLLL